MLVFSHKYNADISIKLLHGPVPQGCGLTSSESEPCFCRRVETDELMSQYWHIDDVLGCLQKKVPRMWSRVAKAKCISN